MASPTVTTGKNQPNKPLLRIPKPPLAIRRLAAWVVEVSLLAATGVVPFQLGEYTRVNFTSEQVPLNPVLVSTSEAIAQTLAQPVTSRERQVSPLTNLFWSAALATPILLASWQLFLLSTTGQTSPKRWFGVRVIAASGEHPGIIRAFVREAIGRWGLPVGTAYVIWRYSGAFPNLEILAGVVGVFLLVEALSGPLNRHGRAMHDRLAGTYVVSQQVAIAPDDSTTEAIVLTPESISRRRSLWNWMRQHPGMTLLIVSIAGMSSVLGTFVGTQIYIQSQESLREFRRRNDQVYLQLVDKLNPDSPQAAAERREAIIALGTISDPRALQFLVDLLLQENSLQNIDAVQQALFSSGPKALPYLQRANQALLNDIAAIKPGSNRQQQKILQLRLRATKQAIAKILNIYSSETHDADLSRAHLGQTRDPLPFTLRLDQTDLSGINFRGAILSNASFKYSRFYGAGADEHLGTFDDWIADLSGANLQDSNLSGALLQNVDIIRTNLIRAQLNQANLKGARLNGSNLSSAQLIGASLEKAVLENAKLTGADLDEANLEWANLSGARMVQVKAVAAKFKFADLSKTEWQGADLSGADLSNTKLENADLNGAKLTGANMSNAVLENVSLRNADLTLVDFRGATLTEVDFKGAIFADPKLAVEEISQEREFLKKAPAGSTAALLSGVDFTNAKNLDANQLSYICVKGAIHPQCPL
ncbi:MAG: pentapeptide repeat-containing protein [Hormoscilla sp.]